MLRELHGCAAVTDGKVGAVEGTVFALHQAVLEPAVIHALYQIERPRAEIHSIVGTSAAVGVGGGGKQTGGYQGECHGKSGILYALVSSKR